MPEQSMDLKETQKTVARFSKERGWDDYHALKNLIISLNIEAGELLSLVEWLSDKEVGKAMKHEVFRRAVEDEISDVLFHLLGVCNKGKINLAEAFSRKFKQSEERFPVEKAKRFCALDWKLKKIQKKQVVKL